MRRELTREELELLLTEIWHSYRDGYMPKDFPLEFGSPITYKALDTMIDDVWHWVDERFGECDKSYCECLQARKTNAMDCCSKDPMQVLYEDVNGMTAMGDEEGDEIYVHR